MRLMHKMMAVALVLVAGVFTALPVQAEDDKAAQEAEREKERRVKEYCSLMARINKDIDGKHGDDTPVDDVTHVPNADVTYGGDVSDMMQMALPEKIEIPVTLDMLGYAGVDAPQGATGQGVMGEAKLAQVDVYLDGRILYNGKDISGNFHDLCAEAEASDTDKKTAE